MGNFLQLIRSTTQIWEVMCHQCGIFAFVSQMLVLWEISGDFSLKPSEQRYRFNTCYCLFHFSVEINIFCFFFLSSDLLLLNQFTIINLNKIILEWQRITRKWGLDPSHYTTIAVFESVSNLAETNCLKFGQNRCPRMQTTHLQLLLITQECPLLLFLGWNMKKGNKCPPVNYYPLSTLKSALGVSLSIYIIVSY